MVNCAGKVLALQASDLVSLCSFAILKRAERLPAAPVEAGSPQHFLEGKSFGIWKCQK